MIDAIAELKLDYAFLPTPNQILASAAGANPNTIDLQVIVSNAGLQIVTIHEVTIEIPTGEAESRDISTATNLPGATYDRSIPWTITTAGSTITIRPSTGASGPVTVPIVFSLPGIQVNEVPGTVPITVTEFAPPAPKVVAADRYSLLKRPADFPVTSFYADPPFVTDLDQPVTLYWTSSDQGQADLFGLSADFSGPPPVQQRADGRSAPPAPATTILTQFRNCISDGNCYTYQDGVAGVPVAAVNQTTTFLLDVVQTDSSGHRMVVTSLSTTVAVNLPWITPESFTDGSPSGRLVRVHWLAFNAASCTLELDGVVVADNAPTDTYVDGYFALLSGEPSAHQFVVTAYAATGRARASLGIEPPAQVTGPQTIGTDMGPESIAFTPDGTLALVANGRDGTVTVIDVATLAAEPQAISVGGGPATVAITPDGTLALVTNGTSDSVSVVDIAKRTAEPKTIPVTQPGGVAITPDGTRALVTSNTESIVVEIEIATRAISRLIKVAPAPTAIAISPDGSLALVVSFDVSGAGSVTVLDVGTGRDEPTRIPVGSGAIAIAFTPDGKQALVANALSNSVTVIDVPARKAVATVPVGSQPSGIAITSNGACAVVANAADENLSVIDLAKRTSSSFPGGTTATAVAIAPGDSLLLAANLNDDQVSVF